MIADAIGRNLGVVRISEQNESGQFVGNLRSRIPGHFSHSVVVFLYRKSTRFCPLHQRSNGVGNHMFSVVVLIRLHNLLMRTRMHLR